MLTDSDKERFWNKIDVRTPDECWEWAAGRTGQGYGAFHLAGHTVLAHRVAYELTYGPVPEGLVVRHRECDNPPCCNPRHLMPGTHKQNKADETGKMRHLFGERHHLTPLTEADVRAMRDAHVQGARPHALAKQYGISSTAVINILRGKSWRCVSHGVDVYVSHAKAATARRRAALAEIRQTHTQTEAAKILGISQAAVSWLESH